MQKVIAAIEKIQVIIFLIFLLLLPLTLFPQTTSPFDVPKLLLTGVACGLIIFLAAIKVTCKNSISFSTSNLDLPVFLLAITYTLSAILKTPNKTEAFFQPGTAAVFGLGAIVFFLANSLFAKRREALTTVLFLSGVLVSFFSLILTAGATAKIPNLPAFLQNSSFSPFGNKLPEAIFLAVVAPFGIALIVKEKALVKKVFYGVCLGVVALSFALAVYKILPGKPASPVFPSYSTSWAVAVDTLKNSPFLGIGPGNYTTAFNRFRPLSDNSTAVWNFKFGASHSFLLTLITETGLIGLVFLAFLFYKLGKMAKKDPAFVSPGILGLSLIFFPGYLTSILVFFVLLAVFSAKKEVQVNLKMADASAVGSRIPAIIVATLTVAAVAGVTFITVKATSAEYNYARALLAINRGDGQAAYNAISRAIRTNPRADRYHATVSQMDIAVASGIAQKKDLTDADKTTVSQLIQEAIAEAKNTVFLNPRRAGNWENLANIYRSIMPFAQGADNFTVQAYNQAIALDPVNPNLRISLGGVYFALGRYDEAIDAFKLAALAKQDLANAHYNLAVAYREKGNYPNAISEINIVLGLVKPDSADYTLAKNTLDELEKKRPATEATGKQENLTTPKTVEEVIKPPLPLPEEATPPASP